MPSWAPAKSGSCSSLGFSSAPVPGAGEEMQRRSYAEVQQLGIVNFSLYSSISYWVKRHHVAWPPCFAIRVAPGSEESHTAGSPISLFSFSLSPFLLSVPYRTTSNFFTFWVYFFSFTQNNLHLGINQLKGHPAVQHFQKLNPNKGDTVDFKTVFLNWIGYAVSYCYCHLPP